MITKRPTKSSVPSAANYLLLGVSFLVLLAAVVWVSIPSLEEIARKWMNDTRYSHGYLVPAFSAYLLWSNRERFPTRWHPTLWGGLIFSFGLALRVTGSYLFFPWFNHVSILPLLAGSCLLVGGWPLLRWAGPAIAFLFFMLPLPYRVETSLSAPLQRLATISSVYGLKTLGISVYSEGNVIVLRNGKLNVAEACNGLSMLLTFFALSAAVALLSRRPLLDRLAVVLAAIPIALLCNILRIAGTGLVQALIGPWWADKVFHDLGGWLMMPLALGLMGLLLVILAWVFPEIDADPSRRMQSLVSREGSSLAVAGGRRR